MSYRLGLLQPHRRDALEQAGAVGRVDAASLELAAQVELRSGRVRLAANASI